MRLPYRIVWNQGQKTVQDFCTRENVLPNLREEIKIMGKYFGTDGFRGEANKALTAEKAFLTGRYIGWYYSQQHEDHRARIVIGKDTRRSSYTLE